MNKFEVASELNIFTMYISPAMAVHRYYIATYIYTVWLPNNVMAIVFLCSTGGNLLMNLGPNHDGRLMPIFQERLLQMGKLF